jgi:hypothetical protein
MKKKYLAVIFTSMCIIMTALAGCGNTDANKTTSATEDSADTEQNTGTESTGETESGEMTAGTYPDGSSPEFSDARLRLRIDDQEVIIRLYDNTAVNAFLERLPLEDLHFSDLSGIEKPIDRPDEPFSLGEETPGYDPVTGDMVIYRPWGNFTIFYGDFRHSDELVPLGQVESGLDIFAGQTEDFNGTLEIME